MKKTLITRKDLLITLLRDHLVSYRLVQGLTKIGLDPLHYNLNLGETIFTIMGFGNSAEEEKLYEEFLNWSEKALLVEFTINEYEPLDELCRDIYRKLKTERKIRKLKNS